ncbi:MAG: electron transport complex subunit [Oscillospiraceae bacterium]|nr:electron transport complex subunit [Oscillospiraceae bacterium]
MNLKPIRKYRRRLKKTSGLIKNNPVVALGMALPFVIVPTLNLKSGLLMSAFIFAATVPAATLAPVAHKKIPVIYLVPCYTLLAMTGVIAAQLLFRRNAVLLDGLGLYIPLAAVNSIMLDITALNPRKTPRHGLRDSVAICLGFALVACGIGAVREVLGNRTIWGVPFGLYPIKMIGVTLPFFGFIILGFLNALCRSVDRAVVNGMLSRDPVPLERGDDCE